MATQTIQCNANNDLYLPDGRNIVMLTGEAACEQNLLQKSLMRLSENQYNTADGVDYFGAIFTPQPDYDAARQSISSNLLECPDTLMIESVTITIDDDQFDYTANVHTIYGPLNVSGASNA
jgi:hypothetical protein